MDLKKNIAGILGGTAIVAGVSGKKGLDMGMKIGLITGLTIGFTTGVVSASLFVLGKNKIKREISTHMEE